MRPPAAALLIAAALLCAPFWSEAGSGEGETDEGLEPNDDPATAQPLKPGETGRHWLAEGVDESDWFRVQAEKGEVLNVSLYTLDWPALNASLEVYTLRDGGPYREGHSISPHRYESVAVVAPLTGSLYIRVFVGPGGGAGNYTLTARVEAPLEAAAGGRYSGTLYNSTNHPSDIYRVWLSAGDTLSAFMNETPIPPSSDVSIDLYLMDLWPSSPFYTYLDISWWSDPHEALEARAPHDGYYYILVTAFNGSGRYEMSLSVLAGPAGEDDFPPRARTFYATAAFSDTIHQSLDHYDWYKYIAKQGNTVAASVLLDTGWRSGLFELFLLDERLAVLRSFTNFVPAPGPGETAETTDRIELSWEFGADGVFYIMLMAKWGVSASSPEDLTDSPAGASYRVSFRVSRENHPPFISSPPLVISTDEDTPLLLDLDGIFSDPDVREGDGLSYAATGSAHLSPSLSSPPELTIVPAPDWSGREEVLIKAYDSMGAFALLRTNVTVLPVNDPPVAGSPPPPLVLTEGLAYPALLNASALFDDPDLPYGDRLTLSVSPSPLELRVDASGSLSCGPVTAPPGEHSVRLRALDLFGLEASVELNVTVLRVPKPPVARAPSFRVELDEDTRHTGPALSELFYDPDGQPLSLLFRNQGRVALSLSEEGLLIMVPSENWSGSEEVYLEAVDTEGLTASSSLLVVVRPVPDPPLFVSIQPPGNLSAGAGSDAVLRVTAVDSDSEGISYQWRVDGRVVSASSKSGNALALRGLSAGNHIITVVARDPEGMESSHSWAVTILEPPAEGPGAAAAKAVNASGAAAAVGLAAWLAVLVGVSEQGKYALLKLFIIPLYTKLQREEVLDHFTRGRIYGLVESNPGIHYTLIRKRLGVGNGTLTYHLATLEREGFIRSEWDGLYKRFFPAQMPFSKGGAVEPGPVQREILELVKRRPGISQKEISHETGLSKRVVSYHVARMVEAELVRTERDGKRVLCYPSERVS